MKKKAKRVLASLNRPVVVYATQRLETASAALTVEEGEFNHLQCASCHTEVAFGHGGTGDMQPMCPECGGMLSTHESTPTIQLDPIDDESITAVQCRGCGTHNVFEDETLDALGGTVHCSVCASTLEYEVASEDGDESHEEPDGDEDDDDADIDLDDIDVDADEEEEEEATLSPSVANLELDPLDNDVPPGPENPKAIDADDKAIGIAPKGATQAIREEDIGKQLLAADDGEDDVELPLDEAVDPEGDVSLVNDEENARILACVNGLPAMALAKADCGNAERFFERSYRRALLQQASVSGLDGLRKEGFKPLVVSAPIGRIVTARVAALAAKERQKVQASADNLTEDMQQSLQLASLALAKGFKNARSPLAERLVATLQGVGVKSAQQLIAREMASSGLEYAQAVLELANEYRSKSVEFRNELAEALSDAGPLVSEEDDEEEESLIESRVTAAVRSKSTRLTTPVAITASADANQFDARTALQRVRELSK